MSSLLVRRVLNHSTTCKSGLAGLHFNQFSWATTTTHHRTSAMEQPQKRPQELLGLDDDSDNASSMSEEEREEKGRSQHRTKRRRVVKPNDDDESDNPTDDEEAEEAEIDPRFSGKLQTRVFAKASSAEPEPEEKPKPEATEAIITNASKLKPLTLAELAASKAATAKTGVVYLSRIPPFMKPQKVRDLLSRFGTIGRVFLAPEDPKAHANRVKFGGNKKRNFVEGWIEFLNKKDAKLCAETLNAQNVGGKKGNYYYDDVWNMKYLPKFKWHHLQAQIGSSLSIHCLSCQGRRLMVNSVRECK